jgi:hypothetical protein
MSDKRGSDIFWQRRGAAKNRKKGRQKENNEKLAIICKFY